MKVKQEIDRLVSVLQSLTLQRIESMRNGKQREAMQIQEVQVDIDSKIHELELLHLTEKNILTKKS